MDDGEINYCYSTATVTGEGFLGGIVGHSLNSDILNCVALGKVIISDSTSAQDAGRIVQYHDGGSLSNNYARSDMKVNGLQYVPGDITDKNGGFVIAAEWITRAWWMFNAVVWDQTIWDLNVTETRLPTLRGFISEQNPVVP